jgi:hypothetical protein
MTPWRPMVPYTCPKKPGLDNGLVPLLSLVSCLWLHFTDPWPSDCSFSKSSCSFYKYLPGFHRTHSPCQLNRQTSAHLRSPLTHWTHLKLPHCPCRTVERHGLVQTPALLVTSWSLISPPLFPHQENGDKMDLSERSVGKTE